MTLAIVGGLILLAAIALVVWYFFFSGSNEPQAPEPNNFQLPENRIEVIPVVEEEPEPTPQPKPEPMPVVDEDVEDWLSVVYTPPADIEPTAPSTPPPTAPSVTMAPTSYEQFLESGMLYEDAPYEPPLVISPFNMVHTPAPVVNPLAPVGTIDEDDADDCGTISVSGSTNQSPSAIISALERNSAVECMGEAIGNSCETATADVNMTGSVGGTIYVAGKTDGTCGIGMSTVSGTAYLCSLEAIMDYVSADDKDEDEWIDEFDSDPDGTMAMAVANMMNVVSLVGTGGFSCEPYTVN